MVYKVKLDVFEGPFSLLVYLIENAEMSIYDIQIAEITEQYMEYIEHMGKMDVVLAGEFMVLAASLIEIKSKMLLPRMQPEGEGEIPEDPRSQLVEKLLEYKYYKKGANLLKEREAISRRIYIKPQEDLSIYTKNPDYYLNFDLNQFIKAFNLFLQRQKSTNDIKKRYTAVERKQMSVEDRIEQMKTLFKSKKKLRFRELFHEEATRSNVVITFLSMLEMVRQKTIKVYQNVNFGEITLMVHENNKSSKKGA